VDQNRMELSTCLHCGTLLKQHPSTYRGAGRKRFYCDDICRKRAHRAKTRDVIRPSDITSKPQRDVITDESLQEMIDECRAEDSPDLIRARSPITDAEDTGEEITQAEADAFRKLCREEGPLTPEEERLVQSGNRKLGIGR
jgi:hypothetical protein